MDINRRPAAPSIAIPGTPVAIAASPWMPATTGTIAHAYWSTSTERWVIVIDQDDPDAPTLHIPSTQVDRITVA